MFLEELGQGGVQVQRLATTYAAFLQAAFDRDRKRFRNFLSFDRRWLEAVGSEDSPRPRPVGPRHLRRPVAAAATCRPGQLQLFELALPALLETTSPRTWAFGLLGIREYLRRLGGDRLASPGTRHADGPAGRVIRPDGNARLAVVRGDPQLRQRPAAAGPDRRRPGRRQRPGGGRWACTRWAGWSRSRRPPRNTSGPSAATGSTARGSERAQFDQQPIEANATVSACLEAYRVTEDPAWMNEARSAFEWFLGRNDLGLDLYDPSTGGCCDGLQEDRINRNQGAESTLAFLLSLAEMKLLESSLADSGQAR